MGRAAEFAASVENDPKLASTAISALATRPAGRNSETTSSAQLSGGSCSNGIADEGLAKFPYGARRAVCGGDDGVERLFDPRAVFFGDGQRGQQLDRMIAVSRNLREQFVVVEQRDHDQLAKQVRCSRFPKDSRML